jgi:RNase H
MWWKPERVKKKFLKLNETNKNDGDPMKINPEKSAYAWNNDKEHEINLKVENTPIEYLSSKKSYKYLGVFLNLLLDWTDHTNIMEYKYKKSVNCISRKYYLNTKMKVLLVNAVAQATISYSMSFINYDTEKLVEWDTWTVTTLQKGCQIKANASHHIWWNILKLNKLQELNPVKYISTKLRILNNLDTIASEVEIHKLNIQGLNNSPQESICWEINKLIDKNDQLYSIIDTNKTDQYLKNILNSGLMTEIEIENQIKILDKTFNINTVSEFTIATKNLQTILEMINKKINLSHITDKIEDWKEEMKLYAPAYMEINKENIDLTRCTYWNDKPVIWTDGSKTNNNSVAALWISDDNIDNISFETPLNWEIDEIEATAIEAVLHLIPNNTQIIIITDSLVTIENIQTWNKKSYRTQQECNSADVIHRIHKISAEKNLKVEYHHIYSHLDTYYSMAQTDKCLEKIEKVKQHFKYFADMAIKGNQQVDILTHLPMENMVYFPKNNFTNQRFTIKQNGKVVKGNIYKHMKYTLNKQRWDIWKPTGKTITAILNNKSDTHKSLWPLQSNVGNMERSLCKFKHKLLTGLPTKNNMIKRNLKGTSFTIKKATKNDIKYQDNNCINCDKVENTEHIFTCKDKITFWNKLAEKMLLTFNQHTYNDYTSLPLWFPNTLDQWSPSTEAEVELMGWNKEDGAKGVIPKAVTTFLDDELYLIEKKTERTLAVNKILNIWTKQINKTILKIWKERCQQLEFFAEEFYETFLNL